MAWLQRNGEAVDAQQFGMGKKVRGQEQRWDPDGSYYIVKMGNRIVRLTPGDWVCFDKNKVCFDVQSDGKYLSEHILDPTVKKDERPAPPSPVIAVTTEDLEMEREKLIKDAIQRPPEPEVMPPGAPKRKPGRPKGARNKVAVDELEEF